MRVLIIRFSSFGDIFQALEAARHLKRSEQTTQIDWLVRSDFSELLQNQSVVDNVHAFHRKASVLELIHLCWKLAPRYDHLYDAHSNLRSLVARTTIRLRWMMELLVGKGRERSVIIRSKERIRRFLLFRLRMPVLPVPYRGAESYLLPLRKWIPDLEFRFEPAAWDARYKPSPEFHDWKSKSKGALIAFAPSAAWPNKRWPIERWSLLAKTLIKQSPATRFLLLGGPDDTFLSEIEQELGKDVVFNAAGKTSLLASASLLAESDALIANDTGLLHVADRLNLPNVAIIGPTAFGYTSGPAARIAEVSRAELPCKPCSKDGRDRCTNAVHLKCLVSIDPDLIVRELNEALEIARTRGEKL